jgi:hypothetical protein
MRQIGAGVVSRVKEGLLVRLHVQPKASQTEWAGLHGSRLKLRVQAKPADGQANEAVRRFLAAAVSVAVCEVELLRGVASRDKDLLVRCIDPEAAADRIRNAAGLAAGKNERQTEQEEPREKARSVAQTARRTKK